MTFSNLKWLYGLSQTLGSKENNTTQSLWGELDLLCTYVFQVELIRFVHYFLLYLMKKNIL